MKRKILITGSSGQVGSYLVEKLIKNYNVTGADIKKSNIDLVNKVTRIGDIKNKGFVEDITKDIDIIIHTAAQIDIKKSIKNPISDAKLNIIGTLNLLESARKNEKISKFIFFSTCGVYGNHKYLPIDEKHPLKPISPYALSKMTGEKYCMMYNQLFDLPTVVLRPFNIYSNRENISKRYVSIVYRFAHNIKKGKKIIIHGDGSQKRDLIHIKDVASFIKKIISSKKTNGEIFNIGTGKPLSVIDIARLVIKISNKDEKSNLVFDDTVKGRIDESYADISKAKKFGFQPNISIEEGIKEILSG